MPRSTIEALKPIWRTQLFSTGAWTISTLAKLNAGEAGGYRVDNADAPFGAYLKPTKLCEDNYPRAANEKIVADLAYELGFNVPPVVLHRRESAVVGEESRCCLSLIMYPEMTSWQFLSEISTSSVPIQKFVRSSISRYSEALALDLLIGQTDRSNVNNVVWGTDPEDIADDMFLFLDHSFTLNYGDRWAGNGWTNIAAVPVPAVFQSALSKRRLIVGADQIAALPDGTIRDIVTRIPADYMSEDHRQIVCDGLIARKQLVRDYVAHNF